MTWPEPIVNVKGCLPLPHDVSNSLPFLNRTPTYCTVACWPFLTSAPLPAIRVSAFSVLGAAPEPFGTVGFLSMSASPDVGLTVADAGAFGSAIGFWFLASCSALAADRSAALSSLLLPHAAAARARARRATR